MLLEDASLLAEVGDRGIPIAALPDRQLDDVIGVGGQGATERERRGECQSKKPLHGVLPGFSIVFTAALWC